jgi:hypothetical protein
VIGAIDRCPRLRQLSISAELLESRLFRKLFLEPRIFVIRLVGDQDELKLREQIEIHSQKPIHLSTFSKIDFTDKSVQSLFAHFRAVHLESCRLSAKDLMELSKVNTARIEIRWCSMSKSEHQLLLTGVEAATQPANGQSTEPSSNADFAKIRYWIDPQNLQIFVQD